MTRRRSFFTPLGSRRKHLPSTLDSAVTTVTTISAAASDARASVIGDVVRGGRASGPAKPVGRAGAIRRVEPKGGADIAEGARVVARVADTLLIAESRYAALSSRGSRSTCKRTNRMAPGIHRPRDSGCSHARGARPAIQAGPCDGSRPSLGGIPILDAARYRQHNSAMLCSNRHRFGKRQRETPTGECQSRRGLV